MFLSFVEEDLKAVNLLRAQAKNDKIDLNFDDFSVKSPFDSKDASYIKKKIGAKGGQRNIPDGYLLDLSGVKPRLYVIENELASHEPLRHIAVQILEFSLSFETDQRQTH